MDQLLLKKEKRILERLTSNLALITFLNNKITTKMMQIINNELDSIR